jgi:folate-dependent phosphoribosylglycinamide formyltransferase PurN
MRVVIVTGTELHHKSLCGAIAKEFDVVGVIHPRQTTSHLGRLTKLLLEARKYGPTLAGNHLLGRGQKRTAVPEIEEALVRKAEGYRAIPTQRIRLNSDVRDEQEQRYLRSLRPDVTICLGGPVYPKEFVDASPLMLNYHSGISPIYNGAASISFAFANGHPHLCGGTLMLMSSTVDGGGVLAHYLPAVASGDSPRSLFAKTVHGSVLLYTNILEYLRDGGGKLQQIPQPRPLFYTKAFEFGLYHRATTARHLSIDTPHKLQRTEQVVEYWREPTVTAAQAAFTATINALLWRS